MTDCKYPQIETINKWRVIPVYTAVSSAILSRHLEQVTDTDTQAGLCLPSTGLCFLRGPGCVAEWEETCWSLTVLMPHSQGFPGRSDAHKQAHSIPEDMLDRRDHHRPAGNNRPAVAVVPFVTFHYTRILWTYSLNEWPRSINTACYEFVVGLTAAITWFTGFTSTDDQKTRGRYNIRCCFWCENTSNTFVLTWEKRQNE